MRKLKFKKVKHISQDHLAFQTLDFLPMKFGDWTKPPPKIQL